MKPTPVLKPKPEPDDSIKNPIDDEFSQWRRFAFADRTLQTLIAFTLGAAFTKLSTTISEALVMPIVRFFISDKKWQEIVWSPLPTLTFEVGKFIASSIEFIIISIVLFIIWKIFSVKDGKKRNKKPGFLMAFFQRIFPWRIRIDRRPVKPVPK